MEMWDTVCDMRNEIEPEMQSAEFDFNANGISSSLALRELVRHLARISAQNDYNAFLNSLEIRYSSSLEKGPPR
jgi:hypothetical protein